MFQDLSYCNQETSAPKGCRQSLQYFRSTGVPLLPFQLPLGIEEAGFKQEIEENVQVLLGWLSLHPAPRPRAEGVMTFTECISGLLGALASSEPTGARRTQEVPLPGTLPPGDVAVTRSHPKGQPPPSATTSPSSSLSPSQHTLCTHSIFRLFRLGASFQDRKPWRGLPSLVHFPSSCLSPPGLTAPSITSCFHRDPG